MTISKCRYLTAILAFTIALSNLQVMAFELHDPTRTLAVLESQTCVRRFSWQSTRSASDWVKISADAFGPDPVADVIGIIGIIVTVPMTVIAVPFDIAAAPFRTTHKVRFSLLAKAVDERGFPIRDTKVMLTVGARYPESDIVSHHLYYDSVSSQTDSEGIVRMTFVASFGPNKNAGVNLSQEGGRTIQSFWISRDGESFRIFGHEMINKESWHLEPVPGS